MNVVTSSVAEREGGPTLTVLRDMLALERCLCGAEAGGPGCLSPALGPDLDTSSGPSVALRSGSSAESSWAALSAADNTWT